MRTAVEWGLPARRIVRSMGGRADIVNVSVHLSVCLSVPDLCLAVWAASLVFLVSAMRIPDLVRAPVGHAAEGRTQKGFLQALRTY